MTFETFKEILFAQANVYGFKDYELYAAESNCFSVKVFAGEISEYKNTDSLGLSFRGTYHGRIGYAYTEKMDETLIPDLIANAAGNAGIIEAKEIEKLYPGDPVYPVSNTFNPAFASVSAQEKIDLALAMEKLAYSLDARVKSVDYCVLGTEEDRTRIANSYGLDVADRANLAYAYINVRVEENGVTKTGTEIWHGNDLAQFSYENTVRTAVDRALSYLGAQSAATGEYFVLFDNRSAIDLFETFAGVFYAEHAQKGFSLLSGQVGTVIANERITLRDDGIQDLSFRSVPFDSEGVAAQNKTVIENGVLKTLLYNTKSAEKDSTKSTGNGFKPSFRSSVGTSHTNFYIVPSDIPLKQMIASIAKGLYITELAGLHSGANTVSGDFSLSADGFMIENGQISRPVEQITVAGNFYELLKNIEGIASDLRFNIPSNAGAIGMPSLLISKLRISGL